MMCVELWKYYLLWKKEMLQNAHVDLNMRMAKQIFDNNLSIPVDSTLPAGEVARQMGTHQLFVNISTI